MPDKQFSKVSFDDFSKQIKRQIDTGREWRPFYDCSICGEYCGFIAGKSGDDYIIGYNSSCDCCRSPPQERSIEYMFNCLDIQINEEAYVSIAKKFSLQLPQQSDK